MEKAEGWGRSRRDGNGSPTFGRKDSWRDAPDSARSRKLERKESWRIATAAVARFLR